MLDYEVFNKLRSESSILADAREQIVEANSHNTSVMMLGKRL